MTIHIAIVLDKSGSMMSMATEAVGAVNQFVDSLKDLPGKKYVTINQFDHVYETTCSQAALSKVPVLEEGINYTPRGTTALYDAIGRTISDLGTKKNVVVCIITDGQENASSDYTYESVKALIEEKKNAGWKFEFLSSDLKSVQVGSSFGISSSAYAANSSGYATISDTLFRSVQDYASNT